MILGRFSPEGRDMSRALRQWQHVVAEKRRKQEKAGKALTRMSPEGRAMNKGFRGWFEYAKEIRERKNRMKNALKRMSPEGRMLYAGMCKFKAKSPSWTPGTNRFVSEDGFWVTSTLNKERESVYGQPELRDRGLFRFGFRVNGSGAGLIVGVADATNRLMPAADCRAWGLHLAHGALYTKKQQSAKGVLSTKQLVPSLAPDTPELDPEATFIESVFDIEVEVDMDRRRLAFGLPGGPLVEAPVKLPARVRPWVYLWNDTDSVMLDSRFQPSKNARKARSLMTRQPPTAKPPAPLRSRSQRDVLQIDGPRVPPRLGPRQPSHAEIGDYLPPYAYTDRSAEDARKAILSSRPRSPGIGLRSARDALEFAKRKVSPGGGSRSRSPASRPPAANAASDAHLLEKPRLRQSGDKGSGAWEEAGAPSPTRDGEYDGYQTPAPRAGAKSDRPPGSAAMSTRSSSLAMTLRTARSRSLNSPRSPRGKGVTHMWDVVRYVSGVYGDTGSRGV